MLRLKNQSPYLTAHSHRYPFHQASQMKEKWRLPSWKPWGPDLPCSCSTQGCFRHTRKEAWGSQGQRANGESTWARTQPTRRSWFRFSAFWPWLGQLALVLAPTPRTLPLPLPCSTGEPCHRPGAGVPCWGQTPCWVHGEDRLKLEQEVRAGCPRPGARVREEGTIFWGHRWSCQPSYHNAISSLTLFILLPRTCYKKDL